MEALLALRTYATKLRLRASVRRVWGLPPVRGVPNPAGVASVLWLWVNHIAKYRGSVKWKEAKAALAKHTPQ